MFIGSHMVDLSQNEWLACMHPIYEKESRNKGNIDERPLGARMEIAVKQPRESQCIEAILSALQEMVRQTEEGRRSGRTLCCRSPEADGVAAGEAKVRARGH